jgi:hypothetical protein
MISTFPTSITAAIWTGLYALAGFYGVVGWQ